MTNFEYIINSFTERDIVDIVAYSYTRPSFVNKIYSAWRKWASSFSPNTGNMAKGCTGGEGIIKDNPSIWLWEQWHMPDGTIEKKAGQEVFLCKSGCRYNIILKIGKKTFDKQEFL